jgi:hypothetical protein
MTKGLRPPFDPEAYREGHLDAGLFRVRSINSSPRTPVRGRQPRPRRRTPASMHEEPRVAGFRSLLLTNLPQDLR